MTTARSGSAPFRPRAHLIRLLGDELISDEVMAVVELVKNAYDADAHAVTVAFAHLTDGSAATIRVTDDGCGMSLDTVLHAWLEPATDFKRRGRRKQRTALGRYQLGEKGVGRFAAAKLGQQLLLSTRGAAEDHEVRLQVDWHRFAQGGYLDEVRSTWESGRPQHFSGARHGTDLTISGLSVAWDVTLLRRVRDGLSSLVSPLSTARDFQITVLSPDYPETDGVITGQLLDRAPYRLQGTVDADGVFSSDDADWNGIVLSRLVPERFGPEPRPPRCGPFRLALFVWDLDLHGLQQASMDRHLRAALRRASGVSLYRDGFRVWPYGSPGDDWLELNQRRVNNPTLRVSTNQIVGVVETSQETNPELRDRTSREGLIDAPAVRDLRALVVACLSLLEERRFGARQVGPAAGEAAADDDPVLNLIGELRARPTTATPSSRALDRIRAVYRQERAEARVRERHLLRLAGTGLAAEQLAVGMARTAAAAEEALQVAQRRVVHGGAPADVTDQLQQAGGLVDLLRAQLDALGLLVGAEATMVGATDLRRAIKQALLIHAHRLVDIGVQVQLEGPEGLCVPMPPVPLLQILLHLLENALAWVQRCTRDVVPEIRIHLAAQPPSLLVWDSGPGIPPERRELVFQPFYSGRQGGRGLGLYQVRTLVEQYGKSVTITDPPEGRHGSAIRVVFA